MNDLDRLAALHMDCPRCRRRPGRPCRYLSGENRGRSMVNGVHAERRIAFRERRQAMLQLKSWLARNAGLLIGEAVTNS